MMIANRLVASMPSLRIIRKHFGSKIYVRSSFSSLSYSVQTQRSPNDSNLSRLCHRDWLAPNEVLKIFENVGDPNSLIPAYERYSNRKDYKPTEALYTLIITRLAQAKKFDEFERIVERIKLERRCRLSEEFFYTVIRVYGNLAGRINKALEILFAMPKYGCWPSTKTFNLALNMLVSAKLFEVVHDLFVSAPRLGVEIDACCLNILIKGLCESGNVEAAYQVLDEFPKQNSKPNVKTFSPLMRLLCCKGKIDEAFGLLDRMDEEGVEPDTITYNILISGLRKQGRVEEGIGLLERMQLKGCEPNPGSYQEVLYGLLDKKRFSEAKEFVFRMLDWGMSPSFVSYKRLIQGLCNEKLVGDVEWVLRQMVRQGFVPKMGIWRHAVSSLFRSDTVYGCVDFDEIIDA